jgi:cellulose synthase/poly-beta-1,6-N-acetylglucosamine synthase-like glycosyltransferase
MELFGGYESVLFCTALVLAVPASFLAEDRNIWKHEFKSNPKWLRAATLILMIYAFATSFLEVLLRADGDPFHAGSLFFTAMPFFFQAMSLCILYSLLWARPLGGKELIRRVRISLIGSAVCLALIASAKSGIFPHPKE